MSWCEAVLTSLRSPCSSPTNSLTAFAVGVILVSVVRVTRSLWVNFKAFILARYFPDSFAIDLKTLGSWAGKWSLADGRSGAGLWHCLLSINMLRRLRISSMFVKSLVAAPPRACPYVFVCAGRLRANTLHADQAIQWQMLTRPEPSKPKPTIVTPKRFTIIMAVRSYICLLCGCGTHFSMFFGNNSSTMRRKKITKPGLLLRTTSRVHRTLTFWGVKPL